MKPTSTLGLSGASPRLQLGQSAEGFDSAVVDRVRLYLKVTFLINLAFAAVAFITNLTGDAVQDSMEGRTLVIISVMTAVNGMAWFVVATNRTPAASTPAVAGFMTLLLSAVFTHVGTTNPLDPNPTRTIFFLLICVTFLLVLRSSLIPSRATTTAAVGVLAICFPIVAAREYATGPDRVFFIWLVVTSVVTVVVTLVTSNAIYGMNRKMRAAVQLGQYQIERLLGRGGMGEVYLAKHALLQRPTAIKLLRDVSAASARDMFQQEVRTASGLSHPNTVEIYDYGRTPAGIFYFAMEYVEGANLEDIVAATGAMPPPRVIHLLQQAAGSLGEAHDRGLVHRDVKPSNLMLCERGGIFDTLKVMDFGLARDLSGDKAEGGAGLSGTPLYLAPETILEADGAEPRSDVYALGATAYFLLAGEPPFPRGNLVEILSDHLATSPPRLECEDAALSALIERCLSKDPDERPHDAKAFGAALTQCGTVGQWTERDAAIWWAEHQEVVTARTVADPSMATS